MTQNTESNYFDLIVNGIGYLNRARFVTPNQGKAYLAVSVTALHGNVDSTNYTYFDVRVVGEAAKEFITAYEDEINDRDSKVMVRFNIGDPQPTSYIVENGERKGQQRHLIKGRLLKITWAKINDEVHDFGDSDDAEPSTNLAEANAQADSNEAAPAQAPVETQQPEPETSHEDLQTWESQLDNVVKLDKTDPEFHAKRQKLKNLGYQWNRDEMAWHKAAA